MSVRASAFVFHESPSTGNDRLVLLSLADEADDDGRNAYPSQDRLALKARIARRTVQRALARLEAGGELLVKRPERQGRGQHNRYVLTLGRDPLELARAMGWPAPTLDARVLEEWASECPPSTTTGEPVDNELELEQKGAEGRHLRPERASPTGARPVLPIDTRARGAESSGQPARRRGLDPLPPTAGEVAVAAQRRRLELEDQRRSHPCPACNGDRLVVDSEHGTAVRPCGPCGGTGVAA